MGRLGTNQIFFQDLVFGYVLSLNLLRQTLNYFPITVRLIGRESRIEIFLSFPNMYMSARNARRRSGSHSPELTVPFATQRIWLALSDSAGSTLVRAEYNARLVQALRIRHRR